MSALGRRVRQVHSQGEIEEFIDGFCTTIEQRTRGAVKGHIDPAYLHASRVTAVVDRDGRMVAGYVIGTRQPLRLLDFVPADVRPALAPPPDASWDDCCEITCFWRRPSVSPLFMSTRVWPRVLSDAIRTRKRFILGHNQSERLDALYAQGGTGITLYQGPSVSGLPSRLSAHATRGIWIRALRVIARESVRRLVKQAVTSRRVDREPP